MADIRTTVTELTTGLGTLGYDALAEALAARPPEMVSVSPETWALLGNAYAGGAFGADFERAWSNGVAFLTASDGLRGRRPIAIEWKGSHKAPGDEVAPIDLRIDHVFLISCKYLSKIMINSSPVHLFEDLLQRGHDGRARDWYHDVAPNEYQRLYEAVIDGLGRSDLPGRVTELEQPERRLLAQSLRQGWPKGTEELYSELVDATAGRSAERWQDALSGPTVSEQMLWRILRMGSSPYFLLGASVEGLLQLRVATPWDWRQQFRLRRLECRAQSGGQARVGWTATVEARHSGVFHSLVGHVEVRWSHGRFGGNPEAKVYLDTPHAHVPGYFSIDGSCA